MPRVSAIVVNHNAASYVEGCLRSLEAEFERSLRPEGFSGEAIVVDSGSSEGDRERLRALERSGVVVLLLDNVGYAASLNAGIDRAAGDFLLFLNPDVVALPGSVSALLRFLADNKDVGAANPRLWLDPERTLLHPPIPEPSIRLLARETLAGLGRVAFHYVSRKRVDGLLRYWARTGPIEVDSLSGAFLATRRDVLERAGKFDPSFSLYFEDADWCRRVRRSGQRLVLVPGAEAVHYYSVSTNQDFASASARHDASRKRYFEKFYGPLGRYLTSADARAQALSPAHPAVRALEGAEDLGERFASPVFELPPGNGRFLCQMAGDPSFSLSVGGFPNGERFGLSPTVWAHMRPGEYFLRLLALPSKRVVGFWRVRKAATPAPDLAPAPPAPFPPPAPGAPRTTSALPTFSELSAPAPPPAEAVEREDVVIAPYQKGDEFRILETFERVFGKERKLASWHYRFLANPIGMHVMLAKGAVSGRVVAQFAGVPVRVSVRGEQHVFAQMVDSMSDPEYRRGLRKPGVFTRTVLAYVEKWGAAEKESLGFGLPNPNAYRIGKKTQGYADLRDLVWRAKPLDPSAPPEDLEAVPKLSIQTPRAPGKRLEELWGKVKSEHEIWTIRDHLYLDWRYWKNPDVNYRYFVAVLANEVVGLAIGVDRFLGEKTFAIADLMVVAGEDLVARHLVAACEEAAKQAECTKILGSFTPEGCREDLVLGRAGYALETSAWKWVGRIYAEKRLDWEDLRRSWFLALGDSDLV